MKGTNWKTTIISLIVASFFLFLAFRDTSFHELWQAIGSVTWYGALALGCGTIFGTIIRGWRWWYTLPTPRLASEFWSFQRAIGVCYAANNFVPRSGEIVRILLTRRETNRSLPLLSSTLVLDRFLLDLIGFIGVFALAFLINARLISGLFEEAIQVLMVLLFMCVAALAGLLFLAFFPERFLVLLRLVQLHRLPRIFEKFADMTRELSLGMSSLKTFRSASHVLFQTIFMWCIYLLVFRLGLAVFDIPTTLPQATLAFAISMLGIVFPSPGGLGTYHFFAQTALVSVYGQTEIQGLAFATSMHAIMYVTNTLYGLLCFGFSFKNSGSTSLTS